MRQLELAALAVRQLVDQNTTATYRRALALNAAWRRARKERQR